MRRPPSAKVASLGVTQTKLAVERELDWLFREQPTEDYGIDAQVEIVDDEAVSGKLLALQIKSGASWFKELGPGGWWYRPDAKHVQYWMNHSLPVLRRSGAADVRLGGRGRARGDVRRCGS